jgi:putative tricarboxylic transport membrane protein
VLRRIIGTALVVLLTFAVIDTLIRGTDRAGDVAVSAETFPDRRISIMAPADPGGGWDETARALQQTIRETKLAPGVEVYNVGGAGGTLGLSQLVSKEQGQPYELMVMGLVMLGAVETNKSSVTVADTTPIAGLTSEPEVVVVPAKSPLKSIDDVMAKLKSSPGSVSVGGGSAGGSDQLLLGLMAKEAGAEPSKTRYVAYSGGGEATAAILSGGVDVGISGVSEFTDQVKAGKMRALAVSSPTAADVGGKSVKSLKQLGHDVELLNWRGIVAPPGISPEEQKVIVDFIERVRATPSWKENEERYGWARFTPSGPAFTKYVASEERRVKALVADLGLAG